MPEQEERKKTFSGPQVLAIVVCSIIVTVMVTLLVARTYIFPHPFTPVVLTPVEQQRLDAKLDRLDRMLPAADQSGAGRARKEENDYLDDGGLRPLPYSEAPAEREIQFTERELNALIATNTDLADKLAIDLSDNLVSARMLVPLDPDMPVFGGKVLRVRAGLELAYREGRPVVKLRGISLMGVPLPNAWLGGMKNIDLVREFGTGEGVWKTFAEGVEAIGVSEGEIRIRLKE